MLIAQNSEMQKEISQMKERLDKLESIVENLKEINAQLKALNQVEERNNNAEDNNARSQINENSSNDRTNDGNAIKNSTNNLNHSVLPIVILEDIVNDPEISFEFGAAASTPAQEHQQSDEDHSRYGTRHIANEIANAKNSENIKNFLTKEMDKSRQVRSNSQRSNTEPMPDLESETRKPNMDRVSSKDVGKKLTIQVPNKNRSTAYIRHVREGSQTTTIIGARREQSIQLYLKDLMLGDQTEDELSKAVIQYGKEVNLRIMYTQIVKNRFCQDTVGCKIRVPKSQCELALSIETWPTDITCREWETRPKRSNTWYDGY